MQTDTVVGSGREVPSAAPPEQRTTRSRGAYTRIAAGLIALGFLVRLGLIQQGWPETNSDEGYLGLMARHIAYQGEHRIFYPGQNYMGPHQAVLGAVLFRLFGSSLFMLRFGLLLLFVLFLVCTYLFARLVYNATWAVICLAFLALGSNYVLAHEMRAIGGYHETMVFGSLLFLLASWLVLTYRPYRLLRECRWRIAVYVAWGFIAGTSLWSDLLGAPFILMSGAVLAAFCWRELLRIVAPVAALGGLLVGAYPLIRYNRHAAPGTDTLSTLRMVRGTPPATWDAQLHAIWNSVRISVPMITGEPFCNANELAAIGPTTSYSTSCNLARDAWGIGYMLLFAVAVLLACWGLWRAWRARRLGERPVVPDAEPTRRLQRQGIHVAMLLSAVIAYYLYAFSATPVDWPGIHARYLTGLLIALPAIFWPLWQGVAAARQRPDALRRALRVACGVALVGYCAFLAVATVVAYRDTPRVRAVNQRDAALIDTLRSHEVTHFYSDYWTCGKITLLSAERVVCATVDDQLNVGLNRYPQYWYQTKADLRAAYVFADDRAIVSHHDGTYTVPVVEELARQTGAKYQTVNIDGYVIYLAV